MKIFLDSSDVNEIRKWKDKVDGCTTNPTLMRKAGITDYEKFCKEVLLEVPDKPVSFEVFADEFDEMERQAKIISSWGENVYVKIPVTNTQRESSSNLIESLTDEGIKLNITAVFTLEQILFSFVPKAPMIISVFAGRIADTGVDPMPVMKTFSEYTSQLAAELLWASPREVLNIDQAEQCGMDIITCTPDLLEKYTKLRGKNLNEFSLDTVKMFYEDAKASGFKL